MCVTYDLDDPSSFTLERRSHTPEDLPETFHVVWMDSFRSDLRLLRKVLMTSFAVGGGLEKCRFH